MRNPKGSAGFTLIEIMVALAIAAAIAAMSYQGLTAASNGAERSRAIMRQVNQLDKTWQIIAADLRHLLTPETVQGGMRFQFWAESLEGGDATGEQRVMFFSRRNWFNPLGRLRSDLQEVSYRVEDGVLWRDYRPLRNRRFDEYEFEEQALRQELLTDLVDLELRFLSPQVITQQGRGALDGEDYARDWPPAWPDPSQTGGGIGGGIGGGTQQSASELPLAVLVRIEIEGMGVSERLFEITSL